MDVYILNKNLRSAGIVEGYKSLIWANRYWNVGEFELALPATTDNIAMCQKGYYVKRTDDDMVCVIEKIEIDTAYDGETQLIVSGKDVTSLLYRRIAKGYQATSSATVENWIAFLVDKACVNPTAADANREFKSGTGSALMAIDVYGLPKKCTNEKRWANLGETVQELCQTVGYGFKMSLLSGVFHFRLYDGIDRSNSVFFTPEYDNLSSTKYTDDASNYKNVAYIVGNGKISGLQYWATYDLSDNNYPVASTNRYEMYVDAKSIERVYTVADIDAMYPNAYAAASNTVMMAPNVTVQIYTPSQQEYLVDNFSGTVVTDAAGNKFFNFSTDIRVADLLDNSSAADSRAALAEYIYDSMLYAAAIEALAKRKISTSFEGSVVPNVSYKYRTDYNLGDIVTVRNEFGLEAQARIIEVLEVFNENGYSIEPKFDYQSG